MAKDKSSMFDFENPEAMFDAWRQGQEAFLKGQTEVLENYNKAFNQGSKNPASMSMPPMFEDFTKAWMPWMQQTASKPTMPDFSAFWGTNNGFFDALDTSNWLKNTMPEQVRDLLDNFSQVPRFADMQNPQADAAEMWREALDFQQAIVDMGELMSGVWAKAYERFTESYSLEDMQSGNAKEALDAWLKSANAELLKAQGSSAFLDAQKRLLRAGTEIRARQGEMAQQLAASYQLPTRTEIDDLAKTVYDLRREVRNLKRDLKALKPKKKKA